MDLLVQHIMRQGVEEDTARMFADRKAKNPRLVSLEHRGRMINLCTPLPTDGVLFNEMVKNGVPPQVQTDSTFMSGTENGRQFQNRPEAGEEYKIACEARGGSVKGRKYISSLARFPGDPEAWVSGRGDVQRVCEQRGWGCEGAVNVPPRPKESPPPKKVDLAEDILVDAVNREIGDNIVSPRERMDIAAKTKDRLTGKTKPKKK